MVQLLYALMVEARELQKPILVVAHLEGQPHSGLRVEPSGKVVEDPCALTATEDGPLAAFMTDEPARVGSLRGHRQRTRLALVSGGLAATLLAGSAAYALVTAEAPQHLTAVHTPSPAPTPPATQTAAAATLAPVPATETPWRPTAVNFAHALVTTRGGREQWLERLSRFVDSDVLKGYRSIKTRALPEGTGPRVVLLARKADDERPKIGASVTYRNGLALRIVLRPVAGEWRVVHAHTTEAPARPPRPRKTTTPEPAVVAPPAPTYTPSVPSTTSAPPQPSPTPPPKHNPAPSPVPPTGSPTMPGGPIKN